MPAPPQAPPRFAIVSCTADHIGDRADQQDRVALLTSPRFPGTLLAVLADGMGGRTGGRLASDQIIDTARTLLGDLSAHDVSLEELLRRIALEAHALIRLSALSAEKDPHSTLVAMALHRNGALWTHAGDSRLYWLRAGRMVQRTADHSYAELLRLHTNEAAAKHGADRFRNYLLNALGMDHPPDLVIARTDGLAAGDAFLLCSDGLWTHVGDREIAALVSALPPREAAESLVHLARERAEGHGDNLSLAIVKLEPPAAAP